MDRAAPLGVLLAFLLLFPGIVEADTAQGAGHDPAYLRIDLGLNAPEGFVSVSGGKQLASIHSLEATLGRGAAANFLGAAYRISLTGPGTWQLAAELGGSLGFPNGSGFDPDIDGENPNTRTAWLHGEVGVQRLASGVVVLAALGLDTLVGGRYHVDAAETNVVDRERGSVQPYVQLGIGVGF